MLTTRTWMWTALPLVAILLAACGDDDNGNRDNIWTGVSGVVIFLLIVWALVAVIRKNRRG